MNPSSFFLRPKIPSLPILCFILNHRSRASKQVTNIPFSTHQQDSSGLRSPPRHPSPVRFLPGPHAIHPRPSTVRRLHPLFPSLATLLLFLIHITLIPTITILHQFRQYYPTATNPNPPLPLSNSLRRPFHHHSSQLPLPQLPL